MTDNLKRLTPVQWGLLLKVAQANEAHDDPPRIKGPLFGVAARLIRLGLLEPGGRKTTQKGWFHVRDNIADWVTCVNCARPRFKHSQPIDACKGFVALNGYVNATAGVIIKETDRIDDDPMNDNEPQVDDWGDK